MVFITVELYKNAGVDVIKVNEIYFWAKMKDVQDGLGIKNISDRLDKKCVVFLKLKILLKNKKKPM